MTDRRTDRQTPANGLYRFGYNRAVKSDISGDKRCNILELNVRGRANARMRTGHYAGINNDVSPVTPLSPSCGDADIENM